MHHHDSAGNEGNLKPGWVQWMTAGSGVVHSEMPTDELLETGGRSEGFQLWVNLPKKYKMVPPRYQDTPPESIPVVSSKGKIVFQDISKYIFIYNLHTLLQNTLMIEFWIFELMQGEILKLRTVYHKPQKKHFPETFKILGWCPAGSVLPHGEKVPL